MVNSKNVTTQVQDLLVLLHDIHAEGMTPSETFQVAAIIEKLPPSRVEFKNYLKHKRKEMSVEDLVVHLCIEEDKKLAQENTYTPDSANVNLVEHVRSSSRMTNTVATTPVKVTAPFLDYKMVNSKNVTTQVQDLLVLLHDIHAEGMTPSETFQVAAIIEKLPPSRVEFKNYLKHKRKEMSVEDLVVHICIEEDKKLAQENTYTPDSANVNLVEHVRSSSRSNSIGKGKDKSFGSKTMMDLA
nr:hypothetical protein [Tanacetum cinerariifolium]